MKTLQSLLLISGLFLFLCISSCKEGAVGPAGAAGPAGVAGPKGDPGTANVIYSDWFTPDVWGKETLFTTFVFSYNKTATQITADIIDKGAVLVYGKLNGYTSSLGLKDKVVQLSYTVVANGSTDSWTYIASPGNVRVSFVNSQNIYSSGPANTHQFRYVIIPGGVKAGKLAGVNWSDYEEVKRTFNLQD